ncbi:pyridoxal phosphate-dependent aminotransferase [Solicola gregarius]|uniref:Aminotransferase n=1 Tax=Solicola gregarius TaxID=2908642 RepID=A0AA46TKW3_9ACTN|nr:pyridoxal phosphate-dependent aminotransferase [Solicola gregarius]UYM06782.1 pyridoxal phosphate-dependent aminotransferase [Solicola gregarius]
MNAVRSTITGPFPASPMTSLVDTSVPFDLAESTCPPLRLGDVVDGTSLANLALDYGTTPGDAELRRLIGANAGVEADQVLVTVGAMGAMYLLAQDRRGGRAVVASPHFPPASIVPAGLGMPVDRVDLSFDDGYRVLPERIAEALTPATTLVSLASPQNPSGVRIDDRDLRDIVGAVEAYAPDAVVLVDETYRVATYGDGPVPASAASLSGRVVTCSSLSKGHGAPGLRLGWLTTTDADLYERLRTAKFYSTVACSTADEVVGVHVLRNAPEILRPRAERLGRALAELGAWAVEQPVDFLEPDGGAMSCLRLRTEDPAAVDEFYARLGERDVRVAPGSWFGESDRVFRVGFGHLGPVEFTEALDRLGDALTARTRRARSA